MWFAVLVSIVVVYAILRYLAYKETPPGPFGVPILGYLPFLDPSEPYVSLTKLSKKYGPIYSIQLGNIFTVVLSDIDLIRDTLKREEFTGRAPLYITHGIMGGHGIICAEGVLWRDQRKLTIDWLKKLGMIKFGNTRDAMEERILQGVVDYVGHIREENSKSFSINPFHILHNALGNVINDFVFGLKYERNDETWKYLQHLQEEGVKHVGVSGVVNFLPLLRYLPSNAKTIKFLKDGQKDTHKLYEQLIETCQSSMDTYKDCVLKSFLIEKTIREQNQHDLVRHCTNKQLHHLLADLFGAGLDTTLTTIRWFLVFTALDQDIQEKLRNEMKQILNGSKPRLEDYDKLVYMRATIAETQRIRSVVPLGIPHGATKDTKIGNFKIPKGTMVIPLLWAVHMNEHEWKEPQKFMPERFVTLDGQFLVNPNLIPFQTGKRMCLGEEMAKMLVFVFCSHFIYNFQYELDNPSAIDTKGICGITLMPPEYSLIIKDKVKM